MRRALSLMLLISLPGAAWAEFDLARLVGDWTGTGRYVDGASGGRLRCEMAVAGHAAEVVMSSRCASVAGAGRSVLRLRKSEDGTVAVTVEEARGFSEGTVGALEGRPEETRLVLRGETEEESAVMVLRFDGPDLLHMAGEYIAGEDRQASVVDFRRE